MFVYILAGFCSMKQYPPKCQKVQPLHPTAPYCTPPHCTSTFLPCTFAVEFYPDLDLNTSQVGGWVEWRMGYSLYKLR